MSMDKYSQDNDLLLSQLQDEEHVLMRKVAQLMSHPGHEKTAETAQTDQRLGQVRSKITELLHAKKQQPSG